MNISSSRSKASTEISKWSAKHHKPGIFKFWGVVLLSFLISSALLGIERSVGIGWDFHPDSVHYATSSEEAFLSIVENWIGLFNSGYYVLSYFLGQSVVAITLMNMALFALTNGFIYKTIKDQSTYYVSTYLLLLLLLNPYRIHLSTTMLKDTLIIFLVILLVRSSLVTSALSFLALFILRIASPIYLIILIPRRFIFYVVLVGLILMGVFWDSVLDRILEFNKQEMQFRDFDRIPNFQEMGFWGSILRGITWSLLALSGTFALISPAPAYIPVAMGSVMTLIFLKKVTGSYRIPLQLLIATSIIGVMVTGFTSYIRYIYPMLVAWPLIAVVRND
jgi:hypothetical protein